MNHEDDKERNYPGVELAYPFAVQSYELAVKRFEVMDSRIQTLLALFVTVSLGALVLICDKGSNLTSYWLLFAAVSFVAAISLGTCGRLMGILKAIDPQMLYEKFLHRPKWEFQKDFIYWAGINYKSNRVQIERKHRIAVFMTFLFCLEVICLAGWVLSGGGGGEFSEERSSSWSVMEFLQISHDTP